MNRKERKREMGTRREKGEARGGKKTGSGKKGKKRREWIGQKIEGGEKRHGEKGKRYRDGER